MGRRKIYTEEEKKQRKKEYDIKYQNKRYENDENYRDKKKELSQKKYNEIKKNK